MVRYLPALLISVAFRDVFMFAAGFALAIARNSYAIKRLRNTATFLFHDEGDQVLKRVEDKVFLSCENILWSVSTSPKSSFLTNECDSFLKSSGRIALYSQVSLSSEQWASFDLSSKRLQVF